MATFKWNATSGSFAAAGNWDRGAIPGAGDVAEFDSGNGTITGAGSVATLTLRPGGAWAWNGQVTAMNFNVSTTATLGAGSTWTIAGTPANGNYAVIGGGANGQGSLAMTGGAALLSTEAASTAAYGLFVGSGSSASSTGSLAASGAGTRIDLGVTGAAVGEAGTGTLTVGSAADAKFASPNSALIAALAIGRQGTGTVQLNGGTIEADGYVYVGRAGTGALDLAGGATFTGGAATTSQGGAASVEIGGSTGSSATTSYFGGKGDAQVTQGSTLHALANLNIGMDGTTGSMTVDGAGSLTRSDAQINVGGGTQRTGGNGTVTIRNGGTMRSGTPAAGLAGIAIGGGMTGDSGTVTVTGVGSLLDANGYRLSLGTASSTATNKTGGAGSLTISAGAHALSGAANYADREAALALAGYKGGTAAVTITGAGSQLVANGEAVLGGTYLSGALAQGGTATVSVSAGGLLQTGAETIEAGSKLTVDASSTLKSPSISIAGGTADLATISSATTASFAGGGLLRLHGATGANTVANFGPGDTIDFAGPGATISGSTVSFGGGTIALQGTPPAGGYQLADDGAGGSQIAIAPATLGVFRFFEQGNGTHFYTSNPDEARGLADPASATYRPDLTPETN